MSVSQQVCGGTCLLFAPQNLIQSTHMLKTTVLFYHKILLESLSTQGVNFTNILRAAFTHRSQKCKKTVKLSSFFALLGSVHVKAACRMLMKLTPGRQQACSKSRIERGRPHKKTWYLIDKAEKKTLSLS